MLKEPRISRIITNLHKCYFNTEKQRYRELKNYGKLYGNYMLKEPRISRIFPKTISTQRHKGTEN